MQVVLLGLDTSELRAFAQSLNEPAYRGNQIAEWIYQRHARSFEEMTNLSKTLRARLNEVANVGRSEIVREQRSRDGTVKLLLQLRDSETIETVGLPYEDRLSCCISSQVGCPMRCDFCATGLSGYTRNLTAGEIVEQVITVNEVLSTRHTPHATRINHVVFMGMGESLLNVDNVLKAVRLLNKEVGIAMRQLTVSTVGIVPGIRRLAEEKLQLTLAVSLHAPTDELRARLIPTMRKWSVKDIIAACRAYVEKTGRRVTFECVLLSGVNDNPAEARELARVLRGLNCHVNLIPFNPVAELGYHAPTSERIRAFREVLERARISVTQRVQRGADIDAACGQLRRKELTVVVNGSMG
jgi:23S rRNA (adenine2503-C2)-methyltransferase